MKKITLFYLLLYVTHITLGPYYIRYLIENKKPKWISKNYKEVAKRTLWITYISFLVIAFFNEYPNSETFIIAIIFSLVSTISFFIKFKQSETFHYGVTDHIVILILPTIYLFFHYNIHIFQYKPTYLTLLAGIFLFLYRYIDQILYKSGLDM